MRYRFIQAEIHSFFDELQRVGVELFLARVAEGMPAARIDLQHRFLHELRREHRRGADRHDLIVAAAIRSSSRRAAPTRRP